MNKARGLIYHIKHPPCHFFRGRVSESSKLTPSVFSFSQMESLLGLFTLEEETGGLRLTRGPLLRPSEPQTEERDIVLTPFQGDSLSWEFPHWNVVCLKLVVESRKTF